MSHRDKTDVSNRQADGFVSRWSRLKQAAAAPSQPAPAPPRAAIDDAPPEPLTDADMPPLASLDESSDYSGFLSEKVSETLRRQALRKLFHSEVFNVCDGLDDYAGDFTSFAKLGDIITADMRHQLALAEERLKATLTPEQTGAPETPASDSAESAAQQAGPPQPDKPAGATGEAMARVDPDSTATVERKHE